MTLTGTAYSYVRFSSEKQSEGDSLRRQTAAAKKFADEHNLVLDPRSYQDLGVSAFKGKNADEGSLGLFLKAVEEGVIKKGSILIVESLDRISREHPMLAQALFLRIINQGITIATLLDNQIYSQQRMHDEKGMPLMFSLVHMMRAHEESALKSKRVREGLAEKRAKVLAGAERLPTAPAWLRKAEVGNGWEVIPEKAKIVQLVFDLAAQNMGAHKIMKQLEEQEIPTLLRAKMWSTGNISSIMSNPAVMGQLVMKAENFKTVEDYYPAIVSKEQYALVQQAMRARQTTGGTGSDKFSNLFSGISYCLYCGSRTRFVATTKANYVHCLRGYAKNKTCDAKAFPYAAAEAAILDRLMIAQHRYLDNKFDKGDAGKRLILSEEIEQLKVKQANAIAISISLPDVTPLQAMLQDLQKQIEAKTVQLQSFDLVQLSDREVNDSIDLFMRLEGLMQKGDSEHRRQIRNAALASIRRILKMVEFGPEQNEIQLTFASGKVRKLDATSFMPQRTLKMRANKKQA